MQVPTCQVSCLVPAVSVVLAYKFADESRKRPPYWKTRHLKCEGNAVQLDWLSRLKSCVNDADNPDRGKFDRNNASYFDYTARMKDCLDEADKCDEQADKSDEQKKTDPKSEGGRFKYDWISCLKQKSRQRRLDDEPSVNVHTDWISQIKRRSDPALQSKNLLGQPHIIYRVLCQRRHIEDDFVLKEEIGQGAFGIVYLAESKEIGYHRAVKQIKKSSETDHETLGEIYALMDVDHPHIAKLNRVYDSDTYFYIVLELCSGPDLFDYIADSDRIPDAMIARIMQHMLKAVQGCHAQYTVHSDVKPENFMFKSEECNQLKMIDLGFCTSINRSTGEYLGTYAYSAPEVSRGTLGPESDIWSCGVVLFLMATRHPLFDGYAPDELVERQKRDLAFLKSRLRWAAEQDVSPECMNLLRSMLCIDRHMRVTAQEALLHPFIANSMDSERYTQKEMEEGLRVLQSAADHFASFGQEPVLVRLSLILMAHLGGSLSTDTEPIRVAFSLLDRSGMGELSSEAFESVLAFYNIDCWPQLEQSFKCVDLDGSGYVSYTTFLAAMLPSRIRCWERLFKSVWDLLDPNEHGFLQPDELANQFLPNAEHGLDMFGDALAEISGSRDRASFEELFAAVRRGHPVTADSISLSS